LGIFGLALTADTLSELLASLNFTLITVFVIDAGILFHPKQRKDMVHLVTVSKDIVRTAKK
jgi:hypothetical protein